MFRAQLYGRTGTSEVMEFQEIADARRWAESYSRDHNYQTCVVRENFVVVATFYRDGLEKTFHPAA